MALFATALIACEKKTEKAGCGNGFGLRAENNSRFSLSVTSSEHELAT